MINDNDSEVRQHPVLTATVFIDPGSTWVALLRIKDELHPWFFRRKLLCMNRPISLGITGATWLHMERALTKSKFPRKICDQRLFFMVTELFS